MSSQVCLTKGKQRQAKTEKLTEAQRLRVIELVSAGASHRQAAAEVSCYRNTVDRLMKKTREHGTLVDLRRSGRPRITSAKEDRLIVRQVRTDNRQSARQVA